MTFPASGLFVATMVDVFDATQLAVDFDAETHKVALYTNSISGPDLTTDTAYAVAPWNANEVPNATGYTTGGATLTGTTYLHISGGNCSWDANDTAWTSSTFSSVRGCLIYANSLTPKASIIAVNFGADYAVTSGTFTIVWNASGIFTLDYIP